MTKSLMKMLTILALSTAIGGASALVRGLPWQPNKQQVEQRQIRRDAIGERHDQIRKSAGISLDEFRAMIQRGAVVIDARSREDYEKAHLRVESEPPVLNMEPDKADAAALNRLVNVSDRPFVIYCNSADCTLGEELYVVLEQNGFAGMKVYVDGWEGITKANLPTISGPDTWAADAMPSGANQDKAAQGIEGTP